MIILAVCEGRNCRGEAWAKRLCFFAANLDESGKSCWFVRREKLEQKQLRSKPWFNMAGLWKALLWIFAHRIFLKSIFLISSSLCFVLINNKTCIWQYSIFPLISETSALESLKSLMRIPCANKHMKTRRQLLSLVTFCLIGWSLHKPMQM